MSERNDKELDNNQDDIQAENEVEQEVGLDPVEENENEPSEAEVEAEDDSETAVSEPAIAAAAAAPAAIAKKSSAAVAVPWVITVIAIVALVITLVSGPSGGLNKTVGKMDGATFKAEDLYNEMSKQMGPDQQSGMLDSLMTLKLIDLEATKAGATVSDAAVTAEIEKIKKSNNFATDADFEAALQQSQMTLAGFKEQIANQLKLRQIFEKEYPTTDADLKAYYDKNPDMFATSPKQVRASHILLSTKAEADAVLAELKAGKDFATLAKQKSQDPGSKDAGGDLNYFTKGQMNAQFEAAAFSLKKGEMSGVVQSDSGFHIIKVTDIKEAVIPAYDTIKDQVKAAYYDAKIQSEGQAWMDKVKKARNYTNLLVKAPAPVASAPASPAASPTASASAQ
jgi:foldase protein PrsA